MNIRQWMHFRRIAARNRELAKNNILSDAAMKLKLSIRGANNVIDLKEYCPNISIAVAGDGNEIRIEEGFDCPGSLAIQIVGAKNKITIGKNVTVVSGLRILVVKGCQGGTVRIGDECTFWDTQIQNYDSESSITIGNDCMFSFGTAVINTDEHLIFKDGVVCNHAKNLKIGDHVWLGYQSCVLKNSSIASGSIVGRSAVVSGQFPEQKSVIVGNPGRVVKVGLDWSRADVNSVGGFS